MIDRKQVLYYLQTQYEDELLTKQIDEMSQLLKTIVDFKVVMHIIQKEEAINKQLISGNDIMTFLNDCDQIIVMIATLGMNVDRNIKKYKIMDMGKAYVLNACANVYLEAKCDEYYEQLQKQYLKQHLYLSDRYACGYQDYPLEAQKQLVEYLNSSKTIGVYVNDHSLLIPSKSMSSVIGISRKKQPMKIRGCNYCDLKETCMLRKVGRNCG